MSVEVRQLVVKSNVLQRFELEKNNSTQIPDETKKAILEECRRLILDMFQEIKER